MPARRHGGQRDWAAVHTLPLPYELSVVKPSWDLYAHREEHTETAVRLAAGRRGAYRAGAEGTITQGAGIASASGVG